MTFLLKKDYSRAKTEKKRLQAKNAMKSFQTMTEYCEGHTLCRHAVFSKYFGDKVPNCDKQCDVCFEPRAVEKRVQAYQGYLVQRAGGGMSSLVVKNGECDFDTDLYEGGRRGMKRSFDDYNEDGSDDGDGGEAEKRAKKDREEAIREEFNKRKGIASKSK